MQSSDLAIIIPTAQKQPLLLEKLLLWLTDSGVKEIVIINTVEKPLKIPYELPLTVVSLTGLFNWSLANNFGASSVKKASLLGFLNDDLQVIQEDWLEKILKAFDDPEIGGVSPVVCLPNGSVPGPAVKLDSQIRNFVSTGEVHKGIFDVPAIAGPALFMRRELFYRVKGFDERFQFTHSDGLMGLALKRLSRVVVHGDSWIRHFERSTRGPDNPADWELFKSAFSFLFEG